MNDFSTRSDRTSGPSADYDKRQARERLRTVMIGLTIGCALSALLLLARSAMKSPAASKPAPIDAHKPAVPHAP